MSAKEASKTKTKTKTKSRTKTKTKTKTKAKTKKKRASSRRRADRPEDVASASDGDRGGDTRQEAGAPGEGQVAPAAAQADDRETARAAEDGAREEADPPKSGKISFTSSMAREEAVAYFAAIVEGLRAGSVSFKKDGRSVDLEVPAQIEVGVKVARKSDKAKISFEIAWRGEGARTLSIVPGHRE